MNRFVLIVIGMLLCSVAAAAGRQLPSLSGVAREAFEQAVLTRGASMVIEAVKYEHGEGVARDPQRAVALYCQAARQGHAEAQYKLGWMYANGRGVERDDAVARMFFEVAADQGHEYAKRMLGFLPGRAGTRFPACMTPPPAQDAPPLARNENDEIDGFLALAPNKQQPK